MPNFLDSVQVDPEKTDTLEDVSIFISKLKTIGLLTDEDIDFSTQCFGDLIQAGSDRESNLAVLFKFGDHFFTKEKVIERLNRIAREQPLVNLIISFIINKL